MTVPDEPRKISDVIPDKFVSWRGNNGEQRKAVEFIVENPEKYNIIAAPTGYGKSLIAVAGALLSREKTYIIVPNTHLVEQYTKEFSIPGIMGRKNYQCTLYPMKRASDCPFEFNVAKCPVIQETLEFASVKKVSELLCDEIPCPYIRARCEASRGDVVVMTYDYFYYAVVKAKILEAPKILIIDEAHLFPEKFQSWFSWHGRISSINMFKILLKEQSTQSLLATFRDNKIITRKLRGLMKRKYGKYVDVLEGVPEQQISYPEDAIGVIEKLAEIERILNEIIIEIGKEVGIDEEVIKSALKGNRASMVTVLFPDYIKYKVEKLVKGYFSLKPFEEMYEKIKTPDLFYPSGEKYRYIFYRSGDEVVVKSIVPQLDFGDIDSSIGAKKYVFMSATIVPKYLTHELGLYSSNASLVFDPITPVDSRRVFFYPYAKLYRDNLDQVMFARDYVTRVIDKTLKNFKDQRGIILVSAKKDIETIMKYSREKRRFIVFAGSAEEKLVALEELKSSKNGVLISTAWEGVDLPDELSRFQIVYQVPFPYMGDPYVSARRKIDMKWYVLEALNKIVQGAGRSVRHEGDYSVTYIFDARFENLVKRYSSFIPRWFVESIEKTRSIDYALIKGKKIIESFSSG